MTKPLPILERFWSHVDRGGENDCWNWRGSLNWSGYGQFRMGGRGSVRPTAHRAAYLLLVGPVPEGLVIDHRCRNRRCVNPAHLHPCTQDENVDRTIGETCKRGHPFTPENVGHHHGRRYCRACSRMREEARNG